MAQGRDHVLHAGDACLEIGDMRLCDLLHLPAGPVAVAPQGEQTPDLLDREAEIARPAG